MTNFSNYAQHRAVSLMTPRWPRERLLRFFIKLFFTDCCSSVSWSQI